MIVVGGGLVKKLIFPSLFIMMLLISGCQGAKDANDASYDLRRDKSAPNYMSNRTGDYDANRNRTIGNDVTNQNPNFLNLNGTRNGVSSGGASNFANDDEKARQVIASTKEFRTDSVIINGNRMWVTVYKKGILTDREKVKAEARLHRKLIHALPRYNIEVRVQEDRR
jgi:hypothetical protein